MKFGVVVFPGSNCEQDTVHVLKNVLNQEVVEIFHKSTSLEGFTTDDCIVLPGGFSYGDYLRSGAIARFSPVMDKVIEFANAGGKVLGICNGFQILCESGLLPGALLRNRDQLFICKNVFIKPANNRRLLNRNLDVNKSLKIPVAHAEGRYFADNDTLHELVNNNQVLFYYCDADGSVNKEANINGSSLNIAGICNKEGNVMGLMPHPERAAEDILGNTDGRMILESLLQSADIPS
jgi:phosphoribosylformylglycinamidine synthase subunit PurQ / glutaminase